MFYEPALRAIDRVAGTPIAPPRPATLEGARPETASALPPPPPPAAEQTPIIPATELIARHKRPRVEATEGPVPSTDQATPSD
jgi:hypothetical protein